MTGSQNVQLSNPESSTNRKWLLLSIREPCKWVTKAKERHFGISGSWLRKGEPYGIQETNNQKWEKKIHLLSCSKKMRENIFLDFNNISYREKFSNLTDKPQVQPS